MIQLLKLLHTAILVFVVSFTISCWNFFVMCLTFIGVMFNLPFDSWERAKIIEAEISKQSE